MKSTLCIVLGVLALPVFAHAKPKLLGSEADYFATAIEQIGTIGTGPVHSTGSFSVRDGFGLFGWYIRHVDVSTWPTLPQLIFFRMKSALESDGWKVPESGPTPRARLEPVHFQVWAERNNEAIEIIVTIFPDEDGRMRVSYSQRRSSRRA